MTRRQIALNLLKQAGDQGVTTADLIKAGVGSRYGARILELRQEGHEIESYRLYDSSWRYRLVRTSRSAQGTPDLSPPSSGVVPRPVSNQTPDRLFAFDEMCPPDGEPA